MRTKTSLPFGRVIGFTGAVLLCPQKQLRLGSGREAGIERVAASAISPSIKPKARSAHRLQPSCPCIQYRRLCDPACGSGSLLLKFAKILGLENAEEGFFGQEINLTTYNLCRINMFLHGVNFSKFDIALGDTQTNPAHWDFEPFQAIVSKRWVDVLIQDNAVWGFALVA